MCSKVHASILSSNAHLIEIQFLSSWVDRLKLDGHLTTEAQVHCSPGDKQHFSRLPLPLKDQNAEQPPPLIEAPALLAKDIAELGEGGL